MATQPQNFSNHARYAPLWHFFAFPVLTINVIVVGIDLAGDMSAGSVWDLLVALALLATVFTARAMAVTAQDRIIRNEERLRLQRLMSQDPVVTPADFSVDQLVGMRFASDNELPELAHRVAAGEFSSQKEIKKAITNWRADTLRV